MSDSEPVLESAAVAEAAGETVGEAKWTALRQLEQRFPGLDKSQVEFTVVSEGERGLLGVGFVPARVIARLTGGVSPSPSAAAISAAYEAGETALSPVGQQLAELLEHVRRALGVQATIAIREGDGSLYAAFHGPELGLVIGKHGQTIDAIQYLATALVFRQTDERPDVIVDAAGYRERRRGILESIADRAADRAVSGGRPVELEPMPSSERKIVHIRLKDRVGIETTSEGAEPNRHVIVRAAQ